MPKIARMCCDPAFFYKCDECGYSFTNISLFSSGESACSYPSCRYAGSEQLVSVYAVNPKAWIEDFGKAFQVMIENGATNLKKPRAA